MNLIEIIGFVGNDPEERVTPAGRKVVSFRIADNMKTGEREETLWWRVSCWGDQFDRIMSYIKKGSALIVHGEIRRRPEPYQDKEGQTQVSLEITATQIRFMPSNSKGEKSSHSTEERPTSYTQSSPHSTPGGFRPGTSTDDFNEDNLPF